MSFGDVADPLINIKLPQVTPLVQESSKLMAYHRHGWTLPVGRYSALCSAEG